jgi:hypothetical protein
MGSELVSLLISWVPLIVLVIMWAWFWRSIGKRWRSPSGTTMAELSEQHLAETRRTNAMLERVALALEKRPQR